MEIPTKHKTLFLLLYVNGLMSSQYAKDVRHMDTYTRTHTHTHTHPVYNVFVCVCVCVLCVCLCV